MTDPPPAPTLSSRKRPSISFLLVLASLGLVTVGIVVWLQPRSSSRENHAERSATEARELVDLTRGSGVTFFRVASSPRKEGPRLREWPILQTKELDFNASEDVRSVLLSADTYAETGAKCFEPGLAFRFRSGGGEVDLIVCLQCNWIYVYGNFETRYWALSDRGKSRLLKIYETHVEVPTTGEKK